MGGFFGRIFWEDFFREKFFGRNYIVEIYKELMFLSRFWGNARRRKEGQEFRSLEVRDKLIALKNKPYKRQKNKKLALKLGILPYQFLTNNDGHKFCIANLSSIPYLKSDYML